jgi:hypothetical protein
MTYGSPEASIPAQYADYAPSRLYIRLLDSSLFQEINVGLSHQSSLWNLQRAQQVMGFSMPLSRRLSRRQDDFELDEATKILDAIQVNPGSPNEEDFTLFCDDAPN